ncbi:DUF3991 and TOPRIM domain-containing protein [Methylosinus sp. LW3]|uniref:DUF3991 and TOPRIM domain-containing protein n=1 Tax=Methylosinus sp. LW3 TaxID=107635 RepID=UPI0004678B5D|nr:DUF3991 and TOPRIM domain-containing protein [Methylosinus sp. LW3]
MSHDPEIEQLRAKTNCAALLERSTPPWRLDRRESTKNCLKYRRGQGEILIVNHEGRGWWDPQSDAKGDVFDLVQHLDPALNFGEVRKVLRRFTGIRPIFPAADIERRRSRGEKAAPLAIPVRWARRPRLRRGSPVWRYLTEERRLPPSVLARAVAADAVREGPYGSAWFAHRDHEGNVSHIEIRGPDFKGSVTGGDKILFRLPGGSEPPTRFALAEAPIDALSLAALENIRADTLYAATGGGMGPKTISEIEAIVARLARIPGSRFCSAADANPAGDRYAARHQQIAAAAGVPFERLRPPVEDSDWNDMLAQRERTTP